MNESNPERASVLFRRIPENTEVVGAEALVLRGHYPVLGKTRQFYHLPDYNWRITLGTWPAHRKVIRRELSCRYCGATVLVNHEHDEVLLIGGHGDEQCCSQPLPRSIKQGAQDET